MGKISSKVKATTKGTDSKEKKIINLLKHPLVVAIITGIIGYIINYVTIAVKLPTEMSGMRETFSAVINGMKESFDTEIKRVDNNLDYKDIQIYDIQNKLNRVVIAVSDSDAVDSSLLLSATPTQEFANAVQLAFSYDVPKENELYSMDYTIAFADKNDVELSAKDLTDIPIFLHYMESEQEVYFCGKISSNGNWDGHCILNNYINGELVLITDAVYDDGMVITRRQAFSTDNSTLWAVSDRKPEGNQSRGDTWRYRYVTIEQEFSYEEASADNIIGIDDFIGILESKNASIEGYYYGNISDGLYNDITGDAYIVLYFDNNKVRTFYKGNFVDGNFDDNTGNAIMIGKLEEEQPKYSYYKGLFKAGETVQNDEEHWINHLSQEKIKEILEGNQTNCPLTGLLS